MKKKTRTIKAIKVGDKGYLIARHDLQVSYGRYLVNGNKMVVTGDRVISIDDKLEYLPRNPEILEYRKGNQVMSVEEYNKLKSWYDEDSSDEDVLRAIANKKQKEGFYAVHKPHDPELVEFEIVGYTQDTGSEFISSVISTERWEKHPTLFTVFGQSVVMDEYKKLAEKYSGHAKFDKPDRPYLRFTKINGSYVFGDNRPFNDYHQRRSFTDLEGAKEYELNLRREVQSVVLSAIYPKEMTSFKRDQLISNLNMAKGLSKRAMIESIDSIIKDLQDYANVKIIN